MKTTLRAKLLQHLINKKKGTEGFTLIELLVVIIIIGILAAIALPSFLNQANRARQTEAVTNVGAINRAQQAYILEEDFFSRSISGLGIGIKVESESYAFGSVPETAAGGAEVGQIAGIPETGGTGAYDAADNEAYRTGAVVYASPTNAIKLKSYQGGTYLLSEETTEEVTSTTILCEEDNAGTDPIAPIAFATTNGLVTDAPCGAGSSPK